MAQKTVVFWRDIPAQVLIRKGRASVRRELPAVFMETIDACAMKTGSKDSDAYLEQWRRSVPVEVPDNMEEAADMALSELISSYSKDRLKTLLENGGKEP